MGAGALGSAIGGFLSKSGYEVTFIGRKDHILAIEENGLKITGIWGNHLIKSIIPKTDLIDVSYQDLILFTTKSVDTKSAAEQLKRVKSIVGDKTIIVSLQNGVGNEEILQSVFGEEKVLGGMVIIGFELLKPGEVKVTVFADRIKIGEMNQKSSERLKKIVKVFNGANLPTDAVCNIKQFLWQKLLYNSALNPLGAILGVNYGKLTDPHTWSIIQEIIKEAFEITKREGIELMWNSPEEYEDFLKTKQLPPTANHRPSMHYDLKKGRKTEIDFLNGKIVELGLKNNISTPVNSVICNLIKSKHKLKNNVNY